MMKSWIVICLVLLALGLQKVGASNGLIGDDVKCEIIFPENEEGKSMPIKGSSSCNMGTTSKVRIWFEEPDYDSCPRVYRVHSCQEVLLRGNDEGNLLRVDLLFNIRNDSGFKMVIGDEQFTCGYYSLEFDLRLSSGEIFSVKRKEGLWTRNFIKEEEVYGEKMHRRMLSLDARLWDGLPNDLRGDVVYIRPRFAFFSFVKDGCRFKSICDIETGAPQRSWQGSRKGELLGEWLPIPAQRFLKALNYRRRP